MADRFSLKDLGNISYVLGMEATRTEKGYLLNQTKYITNLLYKTKRVHVRKLPTPMSSHETLTLYSGSALSAKKYCETFESLQ